MTGRASRLDFWVEERSYTHSASWEVYDSTPSEGGVFANNDIDMPPWFSLGYTGHACPELGRREHLQEFDLINMNGRLDDPIPGRMLSADNHVQSSGNSQSYNRYAYVMNNPMKYTDPSGEFWIAAAAALVVAGISYLVGASRNDWEMDPSKWKSGDSFGIGVNTNSAGSTSLYGYGTAGSLSWAGGANVNGGFGGGLSTFGQASYNEMPSAGTGSINMRGVERAYQYSVGTPDNKFSKIPEPQFQIPEPGLDFPDGNETPGISVYETGLMPEGSGVTLPLFGIFVGSSPTTGLVQHEYGHYLQYKELGFLGFYKNIGAPSVYNEIEHDLGIPYVVPHRYFRTETDANRRSQLFYDSGQPIQNWNTTTRFSPYTWSERLILYWDSLWD